MNDQPDVSRAVPVRWLLLFGALGVAALVVFILLYGSAFPTASIDLKVSRQEAEQMATDYLENLSVDLSDYKKSIIFDYNSRGAVYLQRVLGMEAANELMRTRAPIWYWSVRWFRSQEKEEYRVTVDPAGKIIGFREEVLEDAVGADISQDSARVIAESFLTASEGIDLGLYEEVEASSEKRKNRTDHFFVWKLKDFELTWQEEDPEAGVGTVRLTARVWGDRVGGFGHYFQTPEKFDRDFDATMSQGTLLSMGSFAFMVFILIGSLVVVIQGARRDDVRWRLGLWFGLTVAVIWILANLNSIPLIKSGYDTAMAYGTFLGIRLIIILIAALLYGALIMITGTAGDRVTREVYPGSILRFGPGMGSGTIVGYCLAFLFLGYIVLFYTVGRKFLSVWVMAEGPYSNLLGTSLPFLYPLLVGLLASVSEEFMFRFFAIPFLRKYLKITFLAVFISAVIWSFGHSTAPIFPVYVRGIEVGLAGIAFGYCFLRFGLLSVLVAHYVIDALFVGLPLLRSSEPSFVISGIIVVALAAVPAALALVLRKRGVNDRSA